MLNCNKCMFKQNIPGDTHVSCRRTLTKVIGINQHGVSNGWFAFPFNFDPMWADGCDAYVPKGYNLEDDAHIVSIYKLESQRAQAQPNEFLQRDDELFSKMVDIGKDMIKEKPLSEEFKTKLTDLIKLSFKG